MLEVLILGFLGGDMMAYSSPYQGADNQGYGGTNYTRKLRPVVVLSSDTPWDDVKDLIGEYATYN